MLLHEKMELQRKINRLTLKQLHFGNISERMQKKVDKREKYYSKLEKQIERQANAYVNMANNSVFSNGMNNFNPNSIFATGGAISYSPMSQQAIQQAAGQAGVEAKYVALYMQNSMAFKSATDSEGKTIKDKYVVDGLKEELDADKMQKIIQASQAARYMESAQNQYLYAAKNQYQQQVEEWRQAMMDQLDMQREWEMDLLAEEQADMEAEKDSIDAQLQLAQERKKNIESMLSQSIQDAAPKFGLG